MVHGSSGFEHGDLARYMILVDELSGLTYDAVGRIKGKIAKDSLVLIWGLGTKNPDVYVFVPWPMQKKRISEAIALFGQHSAGTTWDAIEMEWGEMPDSETWLLADSGDLRHYVSDSMSADFKRAGLCPRCGDRGFWKMMACLCPYHGRIL